jgi:hypothetical protein
VINSQIHTSVEQIVTQYGSMTNYIKSQLITNQTFVALTPDEEDYEVKLSYLQQHGEEEYMRKYNSINGKLYKQYGLEKPNFK